VADGIPRFLDDVITGDVRRAVIHEIRFRRRMEIVIRFGCFGLGILLGAAIAGRAQW